MTAMPATVARPGIRTRRALRLGVVVGVLTTLVILALVSVIVGSHHSREAANSQQLSAQRAQLAQWETAVHPLILNAGQVVALGPRQGAAQLQGTEFSAAVNQHMAEGWVARLTQLRAQLASITAPAVLADAQSLLDRSLAGYIEATHDLVAAATATGSRRTSLVNSADLAGQAADRLYDRATAAIAALRAHMGLPVDWSGSS